MSQEVLVLSGPNLNLLGEREPAIYGTTTLDELVAIVRDVLEPHGLSVRALQSNAESVLIDAIQQARGSSAGIIFNPGAFTHSSWALRDALGAYEGVAVEVHLSNPASREPFRHRSTIASVVDGSIAGFGAQGYALAAQAVLARVVNSGTVYDLN